MTGQEMRDQVRDVMRWAGPRMLFRHPLLTVRPLIAARKSAPEQAARPAETKGRSNMEER